MEAANKSGIANGARIIFQEKLLFFPKNREIDLDSVEKIRVLVSINSQSVNRLNSVNAMLTK